MANKIADKKKKISRGQSASARTRSREKNQPVKSSATVHDEEKMPTQQTMQVSKPTKSTSTTTRLKVPAKPTKQESKPVRRGAKELSLMTRFRSSRIGRFVFDAYYELRHKVTWPAFKEARNMTLIVIALSAVIGGLLGLADFGLLKLFTLISGGK